MDTDCQAHLGFDILKKGEEKHVVKNTLSSGSLLAAHLCGTGSR